MEILSLPQLRLAQLQNLTERLLPIVKGIEQLAPQVHQIGNAFDTFQRGMVRKGASSDKPSLDRTRDQYISGLLHEVQAEQYFPHVSETADVLKQIIGVTSKYGFGLTRLPYNEQTAQTDNMLSELETLDLSQLPHLARWLDPIRLANDTFKQAVKEYLEGEVRTADIASATAAAPALEEAVRTLFAVLFAHLQIARTEQLEQAYKEIAQLTASYR